MKKKLNVSCVFQIVFKASSCNLKDLFVVVVVVISFGAVFALEKSKA